MISTKNAYNNIVKAIEPLDEFRMILHKSVGYILAEDCYSNINMPPFRQSAMDGYALNMHNNHNYKCIGEVKAGDANHPTLKSGEAVRIFTGSAVPETANAVIMQEKVCVHGVCIQIETNIVKEVNIRPIGEQIKKDEIALKKGSKLTPAAVGFLASLGITEVTVFKKPTIAIIATGNELVEAGIPLEYGQIYESNSTMLLTALKLDGFTNVTIYKVEDNFDSTYELLQKVISENDVILITGGISVGDYDFVGKVLLDLQVNQIFYKVKQKPGKPLFFGKKEGTTIFALPGNPAAALSCYYIYVNTALQLLSGNSNFKLNKITKTSVSNFTKKGDRAQFLKAIVNDKNVKILEGQSSAMLQTFAIANALVFVPEEVSQINSGDSVEVIPLPL